MAIELVPVGAAEIEQLTAFLQKYFKLEPGAIQLRRASIHWKYFEERPGWAGSRSYVLKSGDRWLAHACVCPMPFEDGSEQVRAILLVDWVSASPGAGAEIYKRFYPYIDALFGNGGSTGARRTIQNLGYSTIGSVDLFSYPLKPWRLFRNRLSQQGIVAAAARLARNLTLVATPTYPTGAGWSAERVTHFTAEHQELCRSGKLPFRQTQRSPELLNYFLKCPFAQVSAYRIIEVGKSRGYFMLANFGEEVRLVDLRLDSAVQEDWSSAVSLAARLAAKTPAALITATATFPIMNRALKENRFRRSQADPLYLYDPQGRFAGGAPLHITPFDGDQAYL